MVITEHSNIEILQTKMGLLSDRSNEFHKLDRTDKLLCLTVLEHNPQDLVAVVNFMVRAYQHNTIDRHQLINELRSYHESCKRMDEEFEQSLRSNPNAQDSHK